MLLRNRITGQLHDVPAHLLYGAYDNTYDGLGMPIAALLPLITSALPMVMDMFKGMTGGGPAPAPPRAAAAPPPPDHEEALPEREPLPDREPAPRGRRPVDDEEPEDPGPVAPTEVVYVPVRRRRRRPRRRRRLAARRHQPLNGFGPFHGYYGYYPW